MLWPSVTGYGVLRTNEHQKKNKTSIFLRLNDASHLKTRPECGLTPSHSKSGNVYLVQLDPPSKMVHLKYLFPHAFSSLRGVVSLTALGPAIGLSGWGIYIFRKAEEQLRNGTKRNTLRGLPRGARAWAWAVRREEVASCQEASG